MMHNLMMDLLDLAQMENNTFKLNKEFFCLFDTIKQAFTVVQHISDKRKITLEAPNVSESEKPLFTAIYGDKHRFIQVIINFMSNSLKFSQSGSKICVNLKLVEQQTLKLTQISPDESGIM